MYLIQPTWRKSHLYCIVYITRQYKYEHHWGICLFPVIQAMWEAEWHWPANSNMFVTGTVIRQSSQSQDRLHQSRWATHSHQMGYTQSSHAQNPVIAWATPSHRIWATPSNCKAIHPVIAWPTPSHHIGYTQSKDWLHPVIAWATPSHRKGKTQSSHWLSPVIA